MREDDQIPRLGQAIAGESFDVSADLYKDVEPSAGSAIAESGVGVFVIHQHSWRESRLVDIGASQVRLIQQPGRGVEKELVVIRVVEERIAENILIGDDDNLSLAKLLG